MKEASVARIQTENTKIESLPRAEQYKGKVKERHEENVHTWIPLFLIIRKVSPRIIYPCPNHLPPWEKPHSLRQRYSRITSYCTLIQHEMKAYALKFLVYADIPAECWVDVFTIAGLRKNNSFVWQYLCRALFPSPLNPILSYSYILWSRRAVKTITIKYSSSLIQQNMSVRFLCLITKA